MFLGFNYATEVKKKTNRFDHRLTFFIFFYLTIVTLSLSQLRRLLLTSECSIPPRTTLVSLCTGDTPWGAAVTAVLPAAGLSFRAAHKEELMLPGKLMVGSENMIKTCKTMCGLEGPDGITGCCLTVQGPAGVNFKQPVGDGSSWLLFTVGTPNLYELKD